MLYLPLRLVITILAISGVISGCGNPKPSTQVNEDFQKNEISSAGSIEAASPSLSNPNVNPKPDGIKEDMAVASGKAEQESCLPVKNQAIYQKSDCAEGLICVPRSSDPSKGSCRVPCGEVVSGRDTKTPGLCASDRSCQSVTSLSLDSIGIYCMPVQDKRDGECSALADDQACSANRICAVSEINKDDAGKPFASSFLCRESCPFGTVGADASCPSNEKCIAYPYESTSQSDSNGKPVMCTESKCDGDLSECECDAENGFKCSALIPGVIAFCDRSAGICTTPVGFASVLDFESGRFQGEKCNEVKGHAYCDNSLFDGVKDHGEALCIQSSEKTGDGFCYAFCSAPALDMNQDGQLLGKEVGQKLNCPSDYVCGTDLGRKLGFVAPIPDKQSPNGRKSCKPENCKEGVPCPKECGIGEAECLSYSGRNGEVTSFCGAPFGNCEPAMSLM